MSGQLESKVCVVTGSGSGMGRATAIEMARQGAKVVVTDISEKTGNQTRSMIETAGGVAIFLACDLRRASDIRELMERSATHFGGIDVLHNNAAVHDNDLTQPTSIDELQEEIWDAVNDINLKAVWLATKYAVPYLKNSKAPAIVNVASTAAFVAYPMAGAYCASKGGVQMLSKASAVDLAKYSIRVNCYCPGAIHTPMLQRYMDAAQDKGGIERLLTGAHLIPRLGKPEEVAKLACFLASEDSSFITGAVYVIDGGTLAWRGTSV